MNPINQKLIDAIRRNLDRVPGRPIGISWEHPNDSEIVFMALVQMLGSAGYDYLEILEPDEAAEANKAQAHERFIRDRTYRHIAEKLREYG